ncbi:acyltransferase family protein [Rhodanobacter sp. DHB23]|uniref:acyltransferase family protein n=1 Tax=Rhodanobacter sp. DHB23 TaxID=2775923 RepID=UPI001780F95A|nr:acyltransferase family protein [Rhodanobacter sp. DHB23]MBD8873107.1 acyltransferase [Rhodanobacter sp. DHB23]
MKGHDYRLGYRADLEGLRAVAILLVVAVHAGVPWLRGGFVGVDVFFVLSGFLITGLLVKEASAAGRLSFTEFYVRRLRRLLPALLAMLLVVGVLASLVLAPAEQRGQSSAAAMAALWLSNIHFAFARLDYFSAGTETNLFLHTWSLGVEEQFYLVWPMLLVWLLGRDGARGVARLKAGMFVVATASLAACVWLTYKAPQLAFYMMPMRAWQFAAGALVWLYFKVPGAAGAAPCKSRCAGMLQVAGWTGLAMIALAAVWFSADIPYPGGYALLPTLGAAGVVAAGCLAVEPAGVSRLLSWRPLQWIGGVSYSWYLWHWPILLLGHAITGSDASSYRAAWVLLSLLLAYASCRCIEAPVRNRQEWLARPRMAIFAALALMLVANSLCVRWNNRADERAKSPGMQRYAMAHGDAPVIYGMGCDDWYQSDRVRICAFGPADAVHTAVLLGDSHAGQWFPAVAKVFDRPGWRLLVLTKSSCPMVDGPFFYARIGKQYTVCTTWRAHALAQIAGIKPDVVLLGSTDTSGFSKEQWITGTTKVLDVLHPAVGRIWLLRDTPSLPFDGPDCLAEHAGRPAWLGLQHACSAPMDDARADQVYRWLGEAANRFANVGMLDMDSRICPGNVCSAERDGLVVFRDNQHLTGSFAASLGPAMAEKLGVGALRP